MGTSAETHKDPSGPAPHDRHREHLRRLRAELTLTAVMIKNGAAAVTASVELMNRLDGRAAARSAPVDFSQENTEPSS